MPRSTASPGPVRPSDPETRIERSPLEHMAFAAMAAPILNAAAELRIADLLASGPRTSADLARQCRAHAPSLRRLLRALAGLGVVAQAGPDRFELTEVGRRLRADVPDSVREVVTMLCGPEMLRGWGELPSGVRTGERGWERANGMPLFEYLGRHPDRAAVFNSAMAQHTRDAAPGIIARADLARFHTVADIGGGDGSFVAAILRAHPDLEGIVFDVPPGLASAPATLAAAGVAERCRVVPGDMFASIPAGADAYLLKQVLHDWDDEPAAAILRNCRRAMSPDARLLILDRMLPEAVGQDDALTLLLDIVMLLVTGGSERTEAELGRLLDGAGLAPASISDRIPPFDYRVIEAIPA